MSLGFYKFFRYSVSHWLICLSFSNFFSEDSFFEIFKFSLLKVDLVIHELVYSSVSLKIDMLVRVHVSKCFSLCYFVLFLFLLHSQFEKSVLLSIIVESLSNMVWLKVSSSDMSTYSSSLSLIVPRFILLLSFFSIGQYFVELFLS